MKNKKNKDLLALVIVVAAILLSMLIIVLQNKKPPVEHENIYQEELTKIQTQSESDSIEAIEEDLLNTEISDIDNDLKEIEYELEQAY